MGEAEPWWSSKTSGLARQKTAADPDRTKAAALLKKRGIANAGKLPTSCVVVKKDPDNAEIKLELWTH